jgi:Uma2 family endonuclease
MGLPQRTKTLTPAEYFEFERDASFKSEYFSGEMFSMAGGSARHSQISINTARALGNLLAGRPCIVYGSDLRIHVSATGLYTYPDASVVCGPIEFHDGRKDTILNPLLIVEVLSESTEAYDRGRKFRHYQRVPAFREYLLISQHEPIVERYLFNADGTWTLTSQTDLNASLTLLSLKIDLPLAMVYDKVEFDAPAPPPANGQI